MLFDAVKREHILQGIEDYEEKGLPIGFGPSSTYDVIYEGKHYPPKTIIAYANLHATGYEIANNFKGGKGTDCFKAFESNGFIIEKKINNMHEKLYALKQEFLNTWPIEKLEHMTLEEYTNLDKTSFCYWLEHITRDLGSIVGGSSYKFGIYKRNSQGEVKEESNRTTDGDYAWFKKYGEDSKEQAFETVKNIIIKIAKSAKANNLEAIDDIDLGTGYKWKIAFLYGDFNCLNMFKSDAFRVIAGNLSIDYNKKTPISKFQRTIIDKKPEDEDYFSFCHDLWQQYQERLIDVKKEFAKWLNKNTFDSYRAYLGNTNKSIEEKLDEINAFFDEVNFFLVDPKKVNALVSTILFLMSKKERIKNPDFVDYDSKNSNGIPKAILGKNNYIKFLKEKFDYGAPNYWIFQGNPKFFDFEAAIAEGSLDDFTVSAHKDKIKVGDKVIIWLVGNNSGCYALAEITSEPRKISISRDDKHWKIRDPNDIKAGIKITHNLFDHPILWSDIKYDKEFAKFKAGNQGSNFSATKREFESLFELINGEANSVYFDVKNKFSTSKFNAYIKTLKRFVSENQFDYDDERVSFNVRPSKNRLVFLIGNRYAFMIEGKADNTFYSFISDEILSEKNGEFKDSNGNLAGIYWNSIDTINGFENDIIYGCKNELNRGHKSPFRKYSNIDFINDVFELNLKEPPEEYQIEPSTLKHIISMPKNQILYGPPGTGKTYALKKNYFPLYTSKETSITAEKNFEAVVKGCSWWEVIAVALIQLDESKVNDIFSHKWVLKKAELSNSKTVKPTLWGQLQSHTIESCPFVNVKSRQQPLIFNKTENSTWQIIAEEVENQIPELYDLIEKVENFIPNPDKVIERFKFVTFHQSFSYEDFIEGIKPIMPENGEVAEDLGYKIEDGLFMEICKDAANDPDNRYAIFIDEINRGNVSAIFGELITLIETDKRKGLQNEMFNTLPYSKNIFSVPSNLDIYGTMNTADRSVEALDTALRRRFEFKEMMPDLNVIEGENVDGVLLGDVLQKINERIELLIDRDHTIGHSYFIGVNTSKKLANAFNNKIVPLLQEYFYGDYGKIGLVLGKGFVEKNKNDKIEFAKFDYENANDFITPTFVLKSVDSNSVIEAVNILLGHLEEKEVK